MANRFTNIRPTQFDYQSTLVPLPFNEIAAVGEAKQKQYESNLVDTQNLLNNIKVKSRPEDQPALKEKIDYYNNKVKNISDKVGNDIGNSDYKRELNQLAGEIKTDLVAGDLGAIQHNANTYQDWLGKVQNSKNYKPFLDRSFYDVAPGQYKGFKNSETGQYNLTSATGIDESLERDKKADELVKGIASNKSGGFKWSKDEMGNDVIVDYKGETISPQKIKATFEPLFKNSEEYNQLEREAEYASKTAGVSKKDYIDHHMNELLSGVTNKYTKKDFEQNLKIDRLPEYQNHAGEENTTPVNIGATNVKSDPNYRADAPSSARKFFKNFSLTKELYANIYPNEGKSIDLNKPFNEDQKTILSKAEKFYGHTSGDKKTQADMINKYLDDWSKFQLNVNVDQYTNPKKVEAENQIYFSNSGKGAKAATTRKFTSLSGEDVGSEETGSDFLKKYGNEDQFAINTTGKLNSDNPYYTAGRVVTVSDKSTGEVIAQYAMSGDNKEMSGGNNLKHTLYKNLKYNPKGEYKLELDTEDLNASLRAEPLDAPPLTKVDNAPTTKDSQPCCVP